MARGNVQEIGLGMVCPVGGDRAQPAQQQVRRMEGSGGQAEGGRSDVFGHAHLRGYGLLPGRYLKAVPVVLDVDLKAEAAHHLDGQFKIGAFVQGPVHHHRGWLLRKRREQQQPRDPLGECSGNVDLSAGGAPGAHPDGRAAGGGVDVESHLGQGGSSGPIGRRWKYFWPGHRHVPGSQRCQSHHEVQGGAGAAGGDFVPQRPVGAAVHYVGAAVDVDPGAERRSMATV